MTNLAKKKRTWIVLAIVVIIAFTATYFFLRARSSKPQMAKICPGITCRDYSKESREIPKEVGRPLDVVVKAQKKILKIPIITYHYVEYVKDPKDTIRRSLNINPGVLEQELKMLTSNGYTTYFVKDIPHLVDGSLPYATKSAVLTFDDGYEDFYTFVFPLLKKYNVKGTAFIVSNFLNRTGFMTDSQIKTILGSGLVEIGAHTRNHVYLKSVSDEKARFEVAGSKKDLEEKFGVRIDSFAYPFGVFNKHTVEIVKEASFSAAVTEIPGSIQSDENMMILSRLRAGRFSGANITSVLENLKI